MTNYKSLSFFLIFNFKNILGYFRIVFKMIETMFSLEEFYGINNYDSSNINIKLKICSFCRLTRECLVWTAVSVQLTSSCLFLCGIGVVLCVIWFYVFHWNLGFVLVETQAPFLLQVISENNLSVCLVLGFLIKIGGISFNFACVLFEKSLKIVGLGSENKLF